MATQHDNDSRALVIGLGFAGLIPFALAATWGLLHPVNYFPLNFFCYYSAGILAFLAGSLWRHQRQRASLLIQSNTISLLAVFALVIFHLEPKYSLLLLISGFVWMLHLDLFFTDYAVWYKQLRSVLSIIVIAMHVVLLTFL